MPIDKNPEGGEQGKGPDPGLAGLFRHYGTKVLQFISGGGHSITEDLAKRLRAKREAHQPQQHRLPAKVIRDDTLPDFIGQGIEPDKKPKKPKKSKIPKHALKATGNCPDFKDDPGAIQLMNAGVFPYSLCDSLATTGDKLKSAINAAGVDAMRNAATRMTSGARMPRLRSYPAKVPGAPSTQRGFVRVPLDAPLEMPAPAPPRAVPARVFPSHPGLPRTAPAAEPRPVMPGGQVEPTPTAPDVRTQEYELDEVLITGTRTGTSTQPVYPGPGPAAPAPSPNRVPRPTGTPPTFPGKTRPRAPVALPRVGKIELPLEPLLAYAVGRAVGRSGRPRSASPGVGTATPLPGRAPPGLQPLTGRVFPEMMQPARSSKTKDCSCDEKKKERKPRAPRSVCYSGTFRERAYGLSKSRGRVIPCT